jgi:hypothetical protein
MVSLQSPDLPSQQYPSDPFFRTDWYCSDCWLQTICPYRTILVQIVYDVLVDISCYNANSEVFYVRVVTNIFISYPTP